MAPKNKDLNALGSYEQSVAAFRQFDKNRDGMMSFNEMHGLMSTLNPKTWTEKHTDKMFSQIDKDHNGAIDIREFIAYLFPDQGGGATDYEKIMALFRKNDANLNGRLDKREFNSLMKVLYPQQPGNSFEALFNAADKDKSGEIDSNELIAYIFGVPTDRAKDARAAQRRDAREERGAAPTSKVIGASVVIEMIYGPNMEATVSGMANLWEKTHGKSIGVKLVCDSRFTHLHSVSARDGKVQFWDRAGMIAFREDPFKTEKTTRRFAEDMNQRDIPRLLAGSHMG